MNEQSFLEMWTLRYWKILSFSREIYNTVENSENECIRDTLTLHFELPTTH